MADLLTLSCRVPAELVRDVAAEYLAEMMALQAKEAAEREGGRLLSETPTRTTATPLRFTGDKDPYGAPVTEACDLDVADVVDYLVRWDAERTAAGRAE